MGEPHKPEARPQGRTRPHFRTLRPYRNIFRDGSQARRPETDGVINKRKGGAMRHALSYVPISGLVQKL